MKTPLATLAALGLALSATTAQAESISIPYKDLNLDTAAGQKTLERRIDKAARKVCGYDRQPTGSRIPDLSVRACVSKAKTEAEAQFASLMDNQSLGG